MPCSAGVKPVHLKDIRPERTREIVAAAGHRDEEEPDVTAIAAADKIATAEG